MIKVLVLLLIPVVLDRIDGKKQERAVLFIFPGTKWCGAGTTAKDYNDLGNETSADLCCRDHDNCNDYINPGETKYNLTNNSLFSRLTCACDDAFRECLKTANTDTSNRVGFIYFNMLNQRCFKEDYICLKYWYDLSDRSLKKRCVSSQFKYGWFSLKKY